VGEVEEEQEGRMKAGAIAYRGNYLLAYISSRYSEPAPIERNPFGGENQPFFDFPGMQLRSTMTPMIGEVRHADKQSRPGKSSSSRHRPYTKRHPLFVLQGLHSIN